VRVFSIIADRLKRTEKGVADFFEEASVYSSDIVGFTKLASESRPREVVGLLNDLYGVLDDVLVRHDVYKVSSSLFHAVCFFAQTVTSV